MVTYSRTDPCVSKHEPFIKREHRRAWRCPECRSRQPKGDNTNTPVRGASTTTGLRDELIMESSEQDVSFFVTHRHKPGKSLKLDKPLSWTQPATDRGTELDPSDIISREELSLFWKELRAARIEMSNFTTSLTDLKATIVNSNERMYALEARLDKLEEKVNVTVPSSDLEGQVYRLKQELQEREQDLLSNDIEIAGIPEVPGEGITHIVLTVANKLGMPLEERDIVDAGRAGAPRALVEGGPAPRPRPIVVRLARRSSRDALLKCSRVRRGATTADMGIAGPPCKFYVNERLTKLNRQLFQRAREIAGRVKWRFVWTRDGKIFVKKENGSTRHRIRTEADLDGVFGNAIVSSEASSHQKN
ncbi:hypothetical protein B5X24_HaOG213389 [Helicoverpa armigera]|nr:hypothetical protein B5X24_HaOG213389 [Helicoverpa armigera]